MSQVAHVSCFYTWVHGNMPQIYIYDILMIRRLMGVLNIYVST